jgi:hypothetical protein
MLTKNTPADGYPQALEEGVGGDDGFDFDGRETRLGG